MEAEDSHIFSIDTVREAILYLKEFLQSTVAPRKLDVDLLEKYALTCREYGGQETSTETSRFYYRESFYGYQMKFQRKAAYSYAVKALRRIAHEGGFYDQIREEWAVLSQNYFSIEKFQTSLGSENQSEILLDITV